MVFDQIGSAIATPCKTANNDPEATAPPYATDCTPAATLPPTGPVAPKPMAPRIQTRLYAINPIFINDYISRAQAFDLHSKVETIFKLSVYYR